MTTGPTLSIKTDGHAEAKADAVVDAFADVRSSAWTPFLTLFRKEVVRFISDNIQYAEFNTKSDYCQCCGYDGEITINDDLQWECPVCHNTDQAKMNVTRRTCGYLGENYWNVGKTKEIKARVLHL